MRSLLLAVALCVAASSSLVAQAPIQPEPPVTPGMVAVRMRNATDCPIAVRIIRDSLVSPVRWIPPQTAIAVHFAPDTVAVVLEMVVSPQLCQPAARATRAPITRRRSTSSL